MFWIFGGLGVIAIAVLIVRKASRRADLDVGSVSDQWIAEHRREP